MKTSLVLVGALLLGTACADDLFAAVCETDERDTYAVYSAALTGVLDLGDDDTMVLRQITLTNDEMARRFIFPRTLTHAVDEVAFEDLFERGDVAYAMKPDELGVPFAIELVDPFDLPKDTPRDDVYWEAFFRLHPATDAVVELTTVGFSCDDAILYLVKNCGVGCSSGIVVLVSRADDGWRFQAAREMWRS